VLWAGLALLGACAGPQAGGDPNLPAIEGVARVLPAVVDLQVVAAGPAARALGRERAGAGVVVTPEGHILTAAHVVLGAERVTATFPSGRQVTGEVAGVDGETGLALLHIPPFPGMVVAPLGAGRSLRLAQLCVAVGSQGGTLRSVGTGSLDAFPPFEAYWEYRLDRVIQTNAVTHPLSPGGPLLDAGGEVIGILAFTAPDDQAVAFAIPVDLVTSVLPELIRAGRVTSRAPRPWLGIYTVTAERGVGVVGVTPGSPADRAGLRQRDLILQVNGVPVGSRGEFYTALWRGRVGDPIELILQREDQSLRLVVRGGDRQAFFASPRQPGSAP
jgi:S1-C subfamily serine protease